MFLTILIRILLFIIIKATIRNPSSPLLCVNLDTGDQCQMIVLSRGNNGKQQKRKKRVKKSEDILQKVDASCYGLKSPWLQTSFTVMH